MPRRQRGSGRPRPGFAGVSVEDRGTPTACLSDRELHDQVITYLTDSNRRSLDTSVDFLDETEAERAQRFSRFLARRYYRDRLHRGFRYSADLVEAASAAENVIDTSEFDAILDSCILGSLGTARAVGDLALSCLRTKRMEEWWNDLLEYEFAFFLQLATSEATPAGTFPQRGLSTVICEFQFRIPEILTSLRRGTVPSASLRCPTTLLFSRTPHGKIYVVELDAPAAAVIHAVDGRRAAAEIGRAAGISQEETTRILAELIGISAIVPPLAETG